MLQKLRCIQMSKVFKQFLHFANANAIAIAIASACLVILTLANFSLFPIFYYIQRRWFYFFGWSVGPTTSPSRRMLLRSGKVCGKVSTCIFISSGFGFNLAPRKLPKFNRVNDKVFCACACACACASVCHCVCLFLLLYFSTLRA